VSAGEGAHRRLTQRNLYAVLQYVDRENPAQSPILTLPAAPHGTAKNPIFTDHQPVQYLRIAQWVAGLGTNDQSPPSETLVNRGSPQNPPGESSAEPIPPRLLTREAQKAKPLMAAKKNRGQPIPETDTPANEVAPASYQEPPAEFLQSKTLRPATAALPRKVDAPSDLPSKVPPMQKVQHGAPLPQEGSKDPFDPEVFNRRYHKADSSSEGGKSPADDVHQEKSPDKG
jgi:hypothetical protein